MFNPRSPHLFLGSNVPFLHVLNRWLGKRFHLEQYSVWTQLNFMIFLSKENDLNIIILYVLLQNIFPSHIVLEY